MKLLKSPCLWMIFSSIVISACIHPISQNVRQEADKAPPTEAISSNPEGFLNHHVLMGGVVLSIEDNGSGDTLEVMEWHLNILGQPTFMNSDQRRFLVKSSHQLDPTLYEPGVLVTLAGVVIGQELREQEQEQYLYPVLDLTEIHLWESPFRYGTHPHFGPDYPVYVGPRDGIERHPYDANYSIYPYTPYWYRLWY